ncbi:MAG: DUF4349 domain-containing protein [Deltaproteobacteria bacterium]|nr:DUF4349 domain-containing protein [Deltaproteobacteria bacterium]
MKKLFMVFFVCLSLFFSCGTEKRMAEFAKGESYSSDVSGAASREGGGGYLSKISSSRDAYAENLKTASQQLIYNAEMEIAVKDFQKTEGEIKAIAEQHSGYIQDTKTYKKNDGKMHGTIKIRVPSERFKQVIKSLASLGEIKSQREWTEDVTEEYIDVSTRIENARKLEDRLLSLLNTKDAKLGDIVSVESKLMEVRTQIEQFEGKLRYLKNRINFSTITVTVYEPQSALAEQESVFYPIIWAARQLGLMFFGSIGIFVLIAAGILPWALIVYAVVRFVRYRRKKREKSE